MKIAYIVLCHQDPLLLARLADALEYENDKLFVHVDAKVDKKEFQRCCADKKNVCFVADTVQNYWGGYNSIVATMKAVKLAFDTDQYDRFVIIQGADYPLYSPGIIHSFFEKHSGEEFCKCKDISESDNKKDYMKWAGFYCNDVSKRNVPLYLFSKFLNRFNTLGIKYRKSCFVNDNGDKWHVFHGWAHVALTKECMQYVYGIFTNNCRYNKFMKHRFPPDEIYVQTIVANSHFNGRISDYKIKNRTTGKESNLNLTYFEYPKLVACFTKTDELPDLKKTGALFVRKVNSETSRGLLDQIDKEKEIQEYIKNEL